MNGQQHAQSRKIIDIFHEEVEGFNPTLTVATHNVCKPEPQVDMLAQGATWRKREARVIKYIKQWKRDSAQYLLNEL
jgi:hypothetical protein